MFADPAPAADGGRGTGGGQVIWTCHVVCRKAESQWAGVGSGSREGHLHTAALWGKAGDPYVGYT